MLMPLSLIGYASGIAAEDPRCGDGPFQLRHYGLEKYLRYQDIKSDWAAMLKIEACSSQKGKENLNYVVELSQRLSNITFDLTRKKKHFALLGGDHTSAIGTWSGVSASLMQKSQGALGLIWIDAHMDSHTFETTPSGNIHGMPLAALLGYGKSALTRVLVPQPKIIPAHLSLIGTRSFESQEENLLKSLNVGIYSMKEIARRGLKVVFLEALIRAKKGGLGFGISLDLDALDPKVAPGVGTPVEGGISGKELCEVLSILPQENNFIGIEIVEYNPYRDKDHKTRKLIEKILISTFGSKKHESTKYGQRQPEYEFS